MAKLKNLHFFQEPQDKVVTVGHNNSKWKPLPMRDGHVPQSREFRNGRLAERDAVNRPWGEPA